MCLSGCFLGRNPRYPAGEIGAVKITTRTGGVGGSSIHRIHLEVLPFMEDIAGFWSVANNSFGAAFCYQFQNKRGVGLIG